MAFLPQNQQQQDPNQQQNAGGQPTEIPAIPSLQGSGGPSVSQSGGTTNTAASPGAAPSSPWQNISSYLQANAGQGGVVADKLAGNLTSQYDAANQGIQQAGQNFGQQIEGARNPYNAGVASQAATAPSQFVQDPNNVQAFQKMFNGSYTGPQDFSHTQDYSALQGQVQKAQGQAGLVNQGTSGLMTLLQQAEAQGGKNPTQGVTALDSLLLQESPDNFSKISNAAKPFSGLTDYLGKTQTGLDTAAQNAAKEAAATQQQLQNQFLGPQGVVQNFQDVQNKGLQDLQGKSKSYNDEIADIMARLGGGQQLTAQQMQDVNPTGELGAVYGDFQSAQLYPGVSPGLMAQYYNQPVRGMVGAPTLANSMTPQQIADARAINQLLGQEALQAPDNSVPYTIPTDKGAFQGKQAIQGVYDALNADQSYLPYMTDQQAGMYPTIMQHLSGLLGLPGYSQIPIQPAPEPNPLPPGVVLQPPNAPPPSGGGHAAR